MLKLQNISLSRGTKTLIQNACLDVFEKMTIGMIGANGCGKSSLFEAIRGKLEPSAGSIDIKKNLMISYLEQEVPALDLSAVEYTISGDANLFEVIFKLNQAEKDQNYDLMMECHNQLAEMDGYSAEARAAKILTGLGFAQEQQQQPVKSFSGGWRMRLNLAKCLFAPSEMMLLDEPTNHLDLETIVWLEEFLKYYPGAILIVSHDRDFLDHTVSHIVSIENHELKLYPGHYSAFETLRAQQIAIQQAQYKKQQSQIAHTMEFVNRFRYKASKARQAQSRLKALEKMELIQPILESSPFQFRFLKPDRMPNPMITMNKADFGYGDKTILHKINVSIMSGERIGLLGINGAGKSTLIKGLCGELAPLHGKVERASSLQIGYFAQHQLDYLPLDISPLELLKKLNQGAYEKDLLTYLGGFGFNRDQSLSPIKQFSGGEKSRIALAAIIRQKPNLLLLDEPTNHLDLEVRQALSFALQSFEGTMILVSHDRYLLRTLVDELWLIENGKLKLFEGSVEDYTHHS